MHGTIARTRAPDPRPTRSRNAIYAAVESLSSTHPSGDITVAAITREAGISRPAFYAQFSGIDDLAMSLLTETFHQIGTGDLIRRRADDRSGAARDAARKLMFHVQGRWSLYRTVLGWKIDARVREAVIDAYGHHVAASMELSPGFDPNPQHRDDVVRYISGGTIAMITAWLLEKDPASPEAMAQRLLAVMPPWLVGEQNVTSPPLQKDAP